ncbi:lysylphosphatidylglycerol synthase transmembrane domain-containing protein [Leptospirillum ferriphilum]|jgi:uncharacterized protein (TIRG00374 family)|uniref:Flippase-like domain-containing protein n=1 Tax=Leptospirillum ferriphilum TaxID=178606 RepID=A0A2I2MGR9_9BACT|nr:lysylphosphatidylglycerol synthase transmembrane domain-containing protein [Leptospirillum ferriphilum]
MSADSKKLQLLFGVLVSILALWFSFRNANPALLVHLLWKGHYGWVLPILIFMNLSFLVRAFFWRTTLSVTKRVSPAHLYGSILVGYMGNNILPFRGGEVVRLMYTRKLEKIGSAVLLSTIFLERFFDVLLLTLVLLLFFFLHGSSGIGKKAIVLGISTTIVFFALVLVARYRTALIRFLKKRAGFDTTTVGGKIAATGEKLLHGLSILASPQKMAILFFLSFTVWGCTLFGCYFYLRIFDLDMHPVMMSLSLLLFTNLALVIPSSPGGIGVVQFATLYAMRLFGVRDEEALALSVVYQVVPFIFTTTLGWYFIHRQHMSLFDRKSSDTDEVPDFRAGQKNASPNQPKER